MNKKVYVITGATSGIGKELVKKFSEENIVYASYRNEQYVEDLNRISLNVIPFYLDMMKPETISKANDFISKNVNKIDTLINVAGCVIAGAVENIPMDRIREQFEVNTFSHIDFTQRLLNKLEGGKIINVSSMASFGIFPFVGPYCASKRALDILFNSLQIEYGDKIKIISVKPGVIATPLWDKSIKNNKHLEKTEKYTKEFGFLKKNAKKNGKKGLDVKKVIETIIKIDNSKNPKSSYTVGLDAKMTELFSKLPQDIINFIVKKGLKFRVNADN